MKRSLVAILTILYFAVSSGIVVSAHYCMGKRLSAGVEMPGKAACACSRKGQPMKCCKTEFKLVKLDDVQKAAYANYSIQAPAAVADGASDFLYSPLYAAADHIAEDIHGPPLLSAQDTYLRNCVFRI